MSGNDSWYFSYGSNLSKQQMLLRTGSVPQSQHALLANYRLVFRQVLNSDAVYATIVPTPDAIVYGVAYLCSPYAMERLDEAEGVSENCYRRETVHVMTNTKELLTCIVYVGESFETKESKPSSNYLNEILTGATEHQLPTEYIESISERAEYPNGQNDVQNDVRGNHGVDF